jgi:hypothetical protein
MINRALLARNAASRLPILFHVFTMTHLFRDVEMPREPAGAVSCVRKGGAHARIAH